MAMSLSLWSKPLLTRTVQIESLYQSTQGISPQRSTSKRLGYQQDNSVIFRDREGAECLLPSRGGTNFQYLMHQLIEPLFEGSSKEEYMYSMGILFGNVRARVLQICLLLIFGKGNIPQGSYCTQFCELEILHYVFTEERRNSQIFILHYTR